jgi:hypothetical protein
MIDILNGFLIVALIFLMILMLHKSKPVRPERQMERTYDGFHASSPPDPPEIMTVERW